MEPEILTYQHPAARPSLDDDIGKAGSDEEAFRGFSRGLVISTDPPFHFKCSFRHQVEPHGGPPFPLSNGFCDATEEEVGFADFSVFAEQVTHPWCCGFAGATTPSKSVRVVRGVVMDSEPKSSHHCLNPRTQDASRISPASEDQDCFSEPNVFSLASHEDHTEDGYDHTVEDECSASQGTCPTSKEPSPTLADDPGGPPGLPPSESFADFCSASTQQDGAEKWTDLKDQSDHMQQVLQSSFPETEVPNVGEEEEEAANVPSLEALLHPQHRPDRVEDTVERAPPGFWLPHQDLNYAAGLKFRWGTSHANRTLLRCLGVVSGNMGPNKNCCPEHPGTTSKPQTDTHRPLNQLNATEQPRP